MSTREKYGEIMGWGEIMDSLVCLLKYSVIGVIVCSVIGVIVAKAGIVAKVGGCSLGMSIISLGMSISISAGCVGVFLIVFATICRGALGNSR
jgi:hypothetical protein